MPLHAPMIADTLVCLLLVLGVAFGLSRPFIGWFRLRPAETVVAGAALSLIAAWGFAWAVFVSGCPLWMDGALPILACVFLVAGRRGLARLLADPAARDLAVGQLIVTAWCVAWLSFIRNYSGGRMDRGLGGALGEGALLPAGAPEGPPFLRHLPAAGPASAGQRAGGGVPAPLPPPTTRISRS